MPETFNPVEYLSFLRERWKFAAGTIASAVLLTAIACWALPNSYTATATLVIEPPGDPRTATAISPIYLESLKTYEQFAASDSLFAKAVQKFHLLPASAPPTVESLKGRVLRVEKPKDTKLLQISATLPDPKQAQTLVQFLAEETVALSRSIANSTEGGARTELAAQREQARLDLERTRKNQAAVEGAGPPSALEDEIHSLGDRKARASEEVLAANATLAELMSRSPAEPSVRQEIAALQARREVFQSGAAALEKEAFSKSAALASLSARAAQAADEVRAARIAFEALAQRATDLAAATGSRSEQLRVVDPGIVPQRPSFPKPWLYAAAALVISAALSLVYLTLQFGLSRRRTAAPRSELKVARGGGR